MKYVEWRQVHQFDDHSWRWMRCACGRVGIDMEVRSRQDGRYYYFCPSCANFVEDGADPQMVEEGADPSGGE